MKRETQSATTRQNLMEAFWRLYCRYGLEGVTVRGIVSTAGYNRSTFYAHFQDVPHVLECLEASLIPTVETLPPLSLPTGTLGMPVDAFFELFARNAPYYAVLLGERGDPRFAVRLKEAVKPLVGSLIPPSSACTPEETGYVLEFVLSAMIGILCHWHTRSDPLPAARMHALIRQLMEEGVLRTLAVANLTSPCPVSSDRMDA